VVFKVDAEGNETVKWAFTGGADGYCTFCASELALDKEGNVYGGSLGGSIGAGTVFKIDRNDLLTPLYNFTGGADGGGYYAVTTIRDNEGNIYGTTDSGGTAGVGVVFKLDPNGTETVLHSFAGGRDGEYPYAALARDEKGNLYGTTSSGGANGHGLVYKLNPEGSENILYSYTASSTGSDTPFVLDKAGNLYGLTPCCGYIAPPGEVFKLDGNGNFSPLYVFTGGTDGGGASLGRLVEDKAGNLYGMTQGGGNLECPLNPASYYGGGPGGGCGVVFKLDRRGKETVLYTFCSQPNCADGALPYPANLVLEEDEGEGEQVATAGAGQPEDSQNHVIRLYGITYSGGNVSGCDGSGCGVVFKLNVPKTED
jgi:uncharacterized repeat protein (TIGR03803 family)